MQAQEANDCLGPVQRARACFKYWLPPLVWMALIFSASADRASFSRTSRLIGPVVRWLFPHWTEEQVDLTVLVVRKLAHFVEYAVLGGLLYRAFWRTCQSGSRLPERRWAAYALALVALYAVTDEWHQAFVPGRHSSLFDVLVDVSGGAAGLMAYRGWVHWKWPRCGSAAAGSEGRLQLDPPAGA